MNVLRRFERRRRQRGGRDVAGRLIQSLDLQANGADVVDAFEFVLELMTGERELRAGNSQQRGQRDAPIA